ncbi:MAG: hypothetical protein DMF39_09770 [Verrucomicrobia bacterium]|nr:MAG: hypothetical protein DMF39_09770 [Verrucomicrobiota bacterium]
MEIAGIKERRTKKLDATSLPLCPPCSLWRKTSEIRNLLPTVYPPWRAITSPNFSAETFTEGSEGKEEAAEL